MDGPIYGNGVPHRPVVFKSLSATIRKQSTTYVGCPHAVSRQRSMEMREVLLDIGLRVAKVI